MKFTSYTIFMDSLDLPLNNTKRKLLGRTEDGEYIFSEPEPLEQVESMRITQDAIDAMGSEELEGAVENARNDDRKTIRAEDFI